MIIIVGKRFSLDSVSAAAAAAAAALFGYPTDSRSHTKLLCTAFRELRYIIRVSFEGV